MTRLSQLAGLPAPVRAKIRATCQRTLDDPAWQSQVVAEAAKRGMDREATLLQARQIIAAIDGAPA